MKDLKDYLQFYIGQNVLVTPYEGATFECRLTGVVTERTDSETLLRIQTLSFDKDSIRWYNEDEIELMLRPLQSIKKDEVWEMIGIKKDQYKDMVVEIHTNYVDISYEVGAPDEGASTQSLEIHWDMLKPKHLHWLITHGFDVFGLIGEGLASAA